MLKKKMFRIEYDLYIEKDLLWYFTLKKDKLDPIKVHCHEILDKGQRKICKALREWETKTHRMYDWRLQGIWLLSSRNLNMITLPSILEGKWCPGAIYVLKKIIIQIDTWICPISGTKSHKNRISISSLSGNVRKCTAS